MSDIHAARARFNARRGVAEGTYPLSKYRSMRYAAANGSYDSFKLARRKFIEDERQGGKEYDRILDGFFAHLRNLDPIDARLNDEAEVKFETEFLTPRLREKLGVAREYANELRITLLDYWEQAAKEEDNPEEQQAYLIKQRKHIVAQQKKLRELERKGRGPQ